MSDRPRLTRDRILRAAVAVADREGLGALTMRRLGAELDVEAMSLYKHVANKDAILDGVVELLVGQIEVPAQGTPWREAMRQRAHAMRRVLAAHSWAIGLLESRGTMGPVTMCALDRMLGILVTAGFAIEDAVHAIWLLDSFVYGHVIQEVGVASPDKQLDGTDLGDDYPYLAALLQRAAGFSLDEEFEFGLGRVLYALEPD